MIDLREMGPGTRLHARVCVIGSGAGGTTAALALADAGIDVILLEAGGERAERATDRLVGDIAGAPEHDPLDRVREARLGGTTSQWGGRCVPLNEVDVERRSWVPRSGWPLTLGDLAPHYAAAGDLLALGAQDWTVAAALPGSQDFLLPGGSAGGVSDDLIWRWSPPVRFWPSFRRRLTSHPRIRLVHHAPVVELQQERAGGPVVAALARAAGRDHQVTADAFVLAGGGLETPRLLLASSAHTPGGIGNSGDQVGRNYMVHPLAEVGQLQLSPVVATHGAADFALSRDGVYVRRMLRVNDATQRELQLRNAAFALWYPDPRDPGHGDGLLSSFALVRKGLTRVGGFKSSGVHRRFAESGDTGQHLGNIAADLPRVARFGGSWVRRRWLGRRTLPAFTATPRSGLYRLRFDAEQSPEPENRVALTRDRDEIGMPRLAVHHRVGRDDRESILRSLEVVAKAVRAGGRATLELPPGDEILTASFGDGTHPMGTARMSTTPRTGVVDAHGRVHDCANLWLVGSATFPTGGYAGPTITIVALALRTAATLVQELRRPAGAV